MALICGATFCILRADFMLEMRKGSSARLMIKVWIAIAQPQLWTTFSYVHFSHRNSGRASTWKKPKLTSDRKSWGAPANVGTGTDSSTLRDFGPTYNRSV